jgi:glycosyltransferase involved in cell wall biosynthesis
VHTFIADIVTAIKSCSSDHSFIIYEERPGASPRKPAWRRTAGRTVRVLGIGRVVGWALRQIAPRFGDSAYAFEEFVRASKIDVVWFLPPDHDPVSSVPYISTPYDLQHRVQPCFPEVSHDWKERERSYATILPRAARIITGTQTGKNEIVALYGVHPDNVVVVPMPTSLPDTRFEGDARADMRNKYGIMAEFLLYPAQFWPHKNHVNLLLALDQIRRDTGLELDLVLTGSDKGNLEHVRGVVASLELGAQVHILGFVPRAELDKLYNAAVALTFPSFFGPDNLPPLEAFARNCPVAAARVAGAEEQLGNAALFFNPSDPADIARAILALYHDHELRAELVRRGKGWSPPDLPRRTLRGSARSWTTSPASGGAGVRATLSYERVTPRFLHGRRYWSPRGPA